MKKQSLAKIKMIMEERLNKIDYTGWQLFALVSIRVLIGWHFLYEGLVKVYSPGWSAKAYLLGAVGPFKPFFESLAQNENLLEAVNLMNEWGLVLIGLSLIIGLLSRWACLGGMVLLMLYYLCTPPFIGLNYSGVAEGNYLLVNKNLIELSALFALFLFPTEKLIGIERILIKNKK